MAYLDEDVLYNNIEEKYKVSKGEARKAYSDVLDKICEMPRVKVPRAGTEEATICVPLEVYEEYLTSNQWALCKFDIECRVSNAGNKERYRKFAKKLKKAIKFLPNNLEVVVRCKK